MARFKPWSIKELLAADMTYTWDVVGMLVRPTYGMDAGELKTLKSYYATARHVGLAGGVPILGHWKVPERQRVLVYVAEGGRIPWTRRYIRICEAHGLDPDDLDGWLVPIFDAGPLDHKDFRDSLRGRLAEYNPRFVHLDPLYPFQPMTVDSNKLSNVGPMLTDIHQICAEHEATFWVTAHMNQGGAGFDLKRVSGAGPGEWADSWSLIRHRDVPDVDGGHFRLEVSIGSRQWGGGTYDLDMNIGHFDSDAGTHDGPITFQVHTASQVTKTDDADTTKRLAARRAIFKLMRKARAPKSKTEIKEQATGVTKSYITAETAALIDEGGLVQADVRKQAKGGVETPLYELAKGWNDD
jgi:hypothetical protein